MCKAATWSRSDLVGVGSDPTVTLSLPHLLDPHLAEHEALRPTEAPEGGVRGLVGAAHVTAHAHVGHLGRDRGGRGGEGEGTVVRLGANKRCRQVLRPTCLCRTMAAEPWRSIRRGNCRDKGSTQANV